MSRYENRTRRRAVQMLLLATILWGLSFPLMKALGLAQQAFAPEASSWFISANSVVVRFAIASLILIAWSFPTLKSLSRMEVWQGLGLGFFSGAGLLLQMDGLAYTSASTSAFLTQCFCLIIPIMVAVRDRKLPSPLIVVCCLIVIFGVGILAKIDWTRLALGRGEWETLLAAVFFSGQILWLERPQFSKNRVSHATLVMFITMSALALPVALWTTPSAAHWIAIYQSPAVWGLTATLILFCTVAAYLLMNYWQPFVPATEAGLIYGVEPIFASSLALFLPAWLSALAALHYPNELLTFHLLAGGGLITCANLLVQRQPSAPLRMGEVQPRLSET